MEVNKVDYYLALNQTQRTWKADVEEMAPWLLFFLKVIQQQSARALALIEEDRIDHLLSEKQMELWDWAVQTKSFSRREAVTALQFPARTIESIIKKFVDLKYLQRVGQGKATRHQVIEACQK